MPDPKKNSILTRVAYIFAVIIAAMIIVGILKLFVRLANLQQESIPFNIGFFCLFGYLDYRLFKYANKKTKK